MSTNRITAAIRTAAVAALIALPALGLGLGGAAVAHPGPHPPAADPIVGSKGGGCSENRVGVDGDTGEQLSCRRGPDGGVWSGTNGGIVGVHEFGSPCDPALDERSQTPEGREIMCTPADHQWQYDA
ncbi:hypothetical protein C8K38_10218 [Rhodococcus sp. OK611]|uniref:hypothetical protein n=1 Tax=unclassified Rhodococcus (in: high G+C Gram-positive bacteria) TaxID=192944 RepID=UPI000BCD6113|nr:MULTISPECIES: hypothetical protein [unclassified Rhodococcus (in: high G+C Gram-positive bacteria)]PTR44880.1 hypothetical protein C8K38_10218 [Rhodococcus sp. OK611]SNX89215.1 hypothetical protein SAMN05447004_10218 [Rhodococcus sp. OK270]